ncbi:MAG: DEAD/DEAH box helicase [Phycisphaerales bacterium]
MPQVQFQPGERVTHASFGEGVVVGIGSDGYLRVFFPSGERRVDAATVATSRSRVDRILENVAGGDDRLRRAWLHVEAHALPLMENAAALTAARIDLLPHQVVLTHRIATASPRRFLIADEVGLGKTIETALILRELASRGELNRALMIVPAGLVNNWHRELNEVFNLDFEVFGSSGDVTDRKSNAFAKHDRLIASVDTLKRRTRVRRILDAPKWDLVVFDEAHHLSAYKSGGKVRKTENYKLAEAMRDHARDLLLLSATPHQGDHFRFWMLVQLLNPTLFGDADEMVEERHRLNSVVFRRTKADACTPDGSPLFARRWVHTESFTMSEPEREFYTKLREYLQDGFDLAKKQGNQGRALGFVMTIFQKIAASSFAAVRSTLRRRQLMLTIHEAILKDQELDIDGHTRLLEEARQLIHQETGLTQDQAGRGEVDRILADLKLRLIRKLDEDQLALAASSESEEATTAEGENLAAISVSLSLPEERMRIAELLAAYPKERETKVDKLLRGLGALWRQNPHEKVVIFATYLATVDLLSKEIEVAYPGQGVVVLRGGDHGTKLAAEKKFRRADGPRVMVCTAAGREGINLQFARVLFNFDLPWNPMDVEQRIGRIHRYGQKDTAQVYNLVLSDTIEGKIFLLLTEKLSEIARTLGKIDEHGNVTEDLKVQILGQLSDRLSYDQLYRDALSDPELKRTREELEAAISNANEARQVVFELFQDLDRFSLDDYKPFANLDNSKLRIEAFTRTACIADGGSFKLEPGGAFRIELGEGRAQTTYSLDREKVQADESLSLWGLDHPELRKLIDRWKAIPPEEIGSIARGDFEGVLTIWMIEAFEDGANSIRQIVPIAIDASGKRVPSCEKLYAEVFKRSQDVSVMSAELRKQVFHQHIEPALERELVHRGISRSNRGYAIGLLGWVEMA